MTERWRVGEAVGARRLRRRQVLAGLGGLASAALLAACGATDPTPTPGTAVSAGGATTTAAKSSTTAQSTSTAASTTAAASASSSKATTSTASSATTTSSAATSAATTPATSTTAAASSAPAASGPAVSLEFWTINLKKNFNDYIQGMIDAYQKDYPNITIKWVDVPGAEIDTKLLTALSGGAAPDTVNVTSNSLFKYRGALTDLKQYAGNQMSGYLDNLVTASQQDGKQVAIPWYYGGPAIAYYNPDIISQAGLDLNSAPKTYDDLLAWGDTIHTKTNIYGSNTFPDYSVFMQEGITLLSDDKKKATFN
ncbi:MAG TPA: extracellular solute-binding protein, partial [Terriglobales bacterium]|nr:extracellular solute-binding protein [Terriglobales bacterium]